MLFCISDFFCTPDEGGVYHDVDEEYPCDVHSADVESPVDDTQNREKDEYGIECLVHGESHTHNYVVDMCLVGCEHFLSFQQSCKCHADDVGTRDEDKGDGGEKGPFAVFDVVPSSHLVFDGEVCYYKSDEQTAGVTHEYLVLAYVTIEVVEEESDDCSAQTDGEKREKCGSNLMEEE